MGDGDSSAQMSYWSSCLWNRIRGHRARSGSTSMRPTTRCTGIRKGASFTATTVATVICRCTSSAASICCARRLRESNQDASAGSIEELERIVGQIRRHWPRTRIHIRGDSGFCRESIMKWCEDHGIGFVLGLARNRRLVRALGGAMHEAHSVHRRTGKPARRFRDLHLPDSKVMESQPPGGGQGGVSVEGGESAVRGDQSRRFSLCCSVCRRRVKPASVRFFGRRFYVGALFVVSALAVAGGVRLHTIARAVGSSGADAEALAALVDGSLSCDPAVAGEAGRGGRRRPKSRRCARCCASCGGGAFARGCCAPWSG